MEQQQAVFLLRKLADFFPGVTDKRIAAYSEDLINYSYSDVALAFEKGKRRWQRWPSVAEMISFVDLVLAEERGNEDYPDAITKQQWERERATPEEFSAFKKRFFEIVEKMDAEKATEFTHAGIMLSEITAREERLGLTHRPCNEIAFFGYSTVPRVDQNFDAHWGPASKDADNSKTSWIKAARDYFKKRRRRIV